MNNKYFNVLKDYEDGAVDLSYGRNLMNTDINFYSFTQNRPTIDIIHEFLNLYSPVINVVEYYKTLFQMVEGQYHSLPIFMGMYEEKKGLLFGFDYDELIYDLDEIDDTHYHLTCLDGYIDCVFELTNFKNTCKAILKTIDDNIENQLLIDYFTMGHLLKVKVNKARSLAEIEKGINDSIEIIVKKLMKSKHLNPYAQ